MNTNLTPSLKAQFEAIIAQRDKEEFAGKDRYLFDLMLQAHELDREWINIDERLPEIDVDVLILEEDKSVHTAYWNGISFDFNHDDYHCTTYNSTHWQPLPNPPTK